MGQVRTVWENHVRSAKHTDNAPSSLYTWRPNLDNPSWHLGKNNIDHSKQNAPEVILFHSAAYRVSDDVFPLQLYFSLAMVRISLNPPKSRQWPKAFWVCKQEQPVRNTEHPAKIFQWGPSWRHHSTTASPPSPRKVRTKSLWMKEMNHINTTFQRAGMIPMKPTRPITKG